MNLHSLAASCFSTLSKSHNVSFSANKPISANKPTMVKPRKLGMATLLVMFGAAGLAGCNNSELVSTQADSTSQTQAGQPNLSGIIGDYASESYELRAQGYDWVGVRVTPLAHNEVSIAVRSRSDIKAPTCTFDGTAKLVGSDTAHGILFQTMANNSVAFFLFKDGTLTIDSKTPDALRYFCSGGGSLAGEYHKLASAINWK